jgi:hypothetical protein
MLFNTVLMQMPQERAGVMRRYDTIRNRLVMHYGLSERQSKLLTIDLIWQLFWCRDAAARRIILGKSR